MINPFPAILCVLLTSSLLAQEDERPDKRPEIASMLEILADKVGASNREDPSESVAIKAIRDLGSEWFGSGDKDRGAIVRGLDRVFLANRRADKDGGRETLIFREAAKALGRARDEGAKKLDRWIGHPKHRGDIALQVELITALGRTQSDKGIKTLEGLLNENTPELLAAAATALGNFAGKELKVRKNLFESLLKTAESTRENARGNDSTANALWRALGGPAQSSMRSLSGAEESSTEAWRRWWNKNKRKNWDEGDGGE